MEFPFKYIILSMIKMLYDRNMELIIDRKMIINYLNEIIKKANFTIEEKKKILNNFNLECELDNCINKYYRYFDIIQQKIIFDINEEELDNLIREQIEEYDKTTIEEIEYTIDSNTIFLEIIGVNIKKELYKILLNLENDIERCYNTLSDLDNYIGLNQVNTKDITDNIKKLLFKRMILLMNTKNLLSNKEYEDLIKYSLDMVIQNEDYDDVEFLFEDENFNECMIMFDVIKKSLFTCNDLYYSTLQSKLYEQKVKNTENYKYSKIKFYLTFLELLEDEIKKDNDISSELVIVKYRLIQVIDTMYDTTIFMNQNILGDINFTEDYNFIKYEVYYFIKELLMYCDEKYRNIEFDTKNISVYVNNIIKKLYIKTYYKLTKDKNIVYEIKNNKLYGINKISSSLLKDIVEKNKTKIKEK